MKKLLLAVAAFAMLFTSCAKDDVVAPVEDKEALVSFCVNSPAVATRYGEGEEATTLYWAVYNADGTIVEALKGSKEIKLSTTVDLKLIQGREYDVLFWAADAEAPYEVDWDAKTMTVKDVLTANQESYDAFFKYESLGEVSGALSKTIELRRPFAQLNIATGDTTDAGKAEFVVSKTAVTVENVYKTLSFVDGTVSDEVDVAFTLADKANGTISVGDKSYDHIAMNYLLVGEKKLVNVELSLSEENSTEVLTRNYSSVPVQRNYRTNIVGNILTSPAEFNVVILPGFAGADEIYDAPEHVATFAQLTAAFEAGKRSIVLDADISIADSYTLTYTTTRSEQSGITIDLNGKTFEITKPTAMLNIGDKENTNKPNITIKNGNLNCKVYALSGNVELKDIAFGGTIAYVSAAQGVISVKHANLTAERCDMKNVKASAADSRPRAFCSEGRSGGYLKLIDCNFPSSSDGTGAFVATKLLRTYINPLSGSAQLELTNCKFGVAANIDASASYSFSNMNLTGCSGGFTFTIPRSKDSLTEEETAIMKAIKNNNSGTIKAYYNGTLVTY